MRYFELAGTTIASHSRIKPATLAEASSFNADFVDAIPATIAKPLINATSLRDF